MILFSCRDTFSGSQAPMGHTSTFSVVSGYICLSHGEYLLCGRFLGHLLYQTHTHNSFLLKSFLLWYL